MTTETKTTLAIALFSFATWTTGNVVIFMVLGWKAWLGIFILITSYNIKWRA